MANITYDKEKVSFHKAQLKKGGENFEISVYPDNAIKYLEGENIEITEIVQSESIFSDVDKGLFASETKLKSVLGTSEFKEVAKIILDTGELQLTAEYRAKLREQKRRRIITIIHANVVDPRTHLPHPVTRLEAAIEQARVKIDEFRRAEDQITEIVKKLQPIIPIKFERVVLKIVASSAHSGKVYSICQNQGTILKGDWTNDGSWVGELEIPAGIQHDVIDKLNSATHGDVDVTISKRV